MKLTKHAQDAIDAWDDTLDIMFLDRLSDPPVRDVIARQEALQRLLTAMRRLDEAAGAGEVTKHREAFLAADMEIAEGGGS